jgi:hypothetical protein
MGRRDLGLFIENGQRINYTCTGWRELELFIANGQRIFHTSMRWRELKLLIANGQRMRSWVVYNKWPTNNSYKYGMSRSRCLS